MAGLTFGQTAALGGISAGTSLIGGLMKQRAARKQQQREIEFRKHQQIAQLEQQRGLQQQQALANITATLRSAFLG